MGLNQMLMVAAPQVPDGRCCDSSLPPGEPYSIWAIILPHALGRSTMPRYPVLYTALSIFIIAATSAGIWTRFHPRDVDVNVQFRDDHVAVAHAIPGIPLPAGVQEGDLVDLRQQSLATRLIWTLPTRTLGQTIDVVGQRDGVTRTVRVTVNDHSDQPDLLWYALPWSCGGVLMAAIALLLIWRGRDRAAFGMAFWAITFLLSAQVSTIPLSGWWGFAIFLLSIMCYLAARVGFYIMVDARVSAAMGPRARLIYLGLFSVLL